MQATARRLSVVLATSCARRRLIRGVRLTSTPLAMSRFMKKSTGVAVALISLTALGFYVFYGCPSLWARDFVVDFATNTHLATTGDLSPEDAALEAIHWTVPAAERIPRDRVSISTTEAGPHSFIVQICYPPQDDSYERMFYEVTLSRPTGTWTVTRLRRCWTGRGLTGWSTGIPS